MKTDSLFYRLFQRRPELATELLGLEFSGDSYRFVSEEIKQTAFRLDGLFKPLSDNPQQPLIFAEVQYQPDKDFYGRFLSEIVLYLYRQKPQRSWLAFVIYPTRKVEKLGNIEFNPFLTLPQLRRIYLEDYRNDQTSSFNLGLIRLIACNQRQTVNLVKELFAQHEKMDAEALDFIETILVYKLPRLSREEIRKMLNVQNVELKQTVFYQEVWQEGNEEGLQKGLQQGLQKGLQKGLQQGLQKGEQLLLQRMLTRRFGQLPDSIKNQLNQANPKQIEEWTYRLLDATTLESVFKDSLS